MKNLFDFFKHQCLREMHLSLRQLRSVLNAWLFFLMMIVFFPLTIMPELNVLRTMAPGFIWIAVLLATLLASERLFQQAYDEGVIEQWLVSGYPLILFIAAKMLVTWFLIVTPLLLLSPFIAILFALNGYETGVLILSLLAGTPAILFLCALAAAMGTGLQQRGMLMGLILLPLSTPVMIFGSAVLTAAMQGLVVQGYLALLSAFSLIAIALLSLAVAAIIRVGLV